MPDKSPSSATDGASPHAAKTFKRPLPANADAPAKARQLVNRAGEGLPQRLVDKAVLVASELVSNAVQHGSESRDLVWFDVAAFNGELTITVADHGVTAKPGGDGLSRFGLQIMRQLADRWTIDAGPSWRVSATFSARPHSTS